MTIFNILINIFTPFLGLSGLFFSSFVLWRKLKEDYRNENIFKFTLIVLLGGIIGFWLGLHWASYFVFWTIAAGAILGGIYSIKKFGFKFFEVIDAAAIAGFWFFLFYYLGNIVGSLGFQANWFLRNFILIGEFLLVAIFIVVYRYLSRNYRRFYWYPSGKIGFAGLLSVSLYFLLRGMLIVLYKGVFLTTWLDTGVNAIISWLLAISLLVIIYKRSGR